jgi:hypothetical protein
MPNPTDPNDPRNRRKRRALWYLLLAAVPLVAVSWVPFYNAVEPSWAGVPFFYWYQLLWVFLTAGLTLIVYRATK